MMKKMMNAIKEYRVAIFSSIGLLIVGLIVIFTLCSKYTKINVKEYKTQQYTFKYDTTWKIKEKKDDSVRLTHGKDGKVDIKIMTLGEEYKYGTSDDILDELLYGIKNQNKDFKLLSKEKEFVTRYNYDGYKLLYENDKNQVMVAIGKKADKVLMVTYEAINSSFDILLDSVQNIIYDFQIVDSSYNLSHKLDIDTTNIKWSKNAEVKGLSNVYECVIAHSNYEVKYTIPKKFKEIKKNSTRGSYDYEGLKDGSIALASDIYNVNLYEYLEKSDSGVTLYQDYSLYRDDDDYSDFKENLQEVNSKHYVYKVSYSHLSEYAKSKTNYEEVVLIYELDTNHIILFNLKGCNQKISKELADSIKITSKKNYSSYIQNKIIDDKLIGNMQDSVYVDMGKVRNITLKLPTKYKEIDEGFNLFENRCYGLDYNEKTEMYDYDVEYDIYSSVEKKIEAINSHNDTFKDNGTYKDVTYYMDYDVNGKKFKIYKGGYTDKYNSSLDEIGGTSYYVDIVAVVYEFNDKSCITAEIKGNGKEVNKEMINELIEFDESVEKEEN